MTDEGSGAAVLVDGVDTRGGEHCETTALGVLLRHAGLDLSEAMLFGLGSGLSFVYWDAKYLDFPFFGGRVRPFELTRNLAAALGLVLDVRETSSARKAWSNAAEALDGGRPVGLQLDSHHLEYFGSRVHFGGHVVALYGYDPAQERAYLVDTAQQGGAVTTSLDSLAAARAAKGPMTARARSFTVRVPERVEVRERLVPAITACASAFLRPPITNLGHRGIEKAAKLVPGWFARATDPVRDLPQAALLMERAGTGGALFRNLYRDFLAEASSLTDSADLRAGHALYAEAAGLWTEIAALIAKAGETGEQHFLDSASTALQEAARVEREAMGRLVGLEGL
ncbi:BtrH N-terminal domain-containing protein [Streptomyces indicus]|uniref:Butirosin biosynthesis protein H, N-terminal n=1 Tax=Streptomyces indicus TaxID=417292 RepID=A0A1G9BL74_9ACTN|nr:BtrH N-terminal domain-containing protein [Streptomyces indicus]SDK40226.1 Butirosin biosynthesis protein H, N-terminal [Streptomyces indicus]